jgi:hypothetical protein
MVTPPHLVGQNLAKRNPSMRKQILQNLLPIMPVTVQTIAHRARPVAAAVTRVMADQTVTVRSRVEAQMMASLTIMLAKISLMVMTSIDLKLVLPITLKTRQLMQIQIRPMCSEHTRLMSLSSNVP